jgi:hypothetical protein
MQENIKILLMFFFLNNVGEKKEMLSNNQIKIFRDKVMGSKFS